MLKAHQACIDLERNVLRIQNREVRFLSEHELPDKARTFDTGEDEITPVAGPSTGVTPAPSQASFPGGGNTLGRPPANAVGQGRAAGRGTPPPPQRTQSRYSEEAINTLMGFGVTREVAISTLDAAGGNLDVAASLLF
jgi:DNA damage-inducible protein 1